jgi:hypothetical protein
MKKLILNKLFDNPLFAKKKALLFGLNYGSCSEGQLRGCVNDIQDMAAFLHNVKGFEIEMYHDEDDSLKHGTTCQGMIRAIQRLAVATWREYISSVVIHYSGHGSYIRDTNNEELDGYDECLCPIDYQTNGVISDDYLHELISSFNPNTRITVVFDCCHSGSALDLPYCYKTSEQYVKEHKKCPVNVTLISGCRDNQTSADANFSDRFSGALTKNMLNILTKNPNITPSLLLDNLHTVLSVQGFTQLPMISSTKLIKNIKLF